MMATSAATPAPATLLKYTQPANLLTSSPLAATPASRQQGADGSPTHAAEEALQARPQAVGMHAPSQATQNTEASHSCTCPLFCMTMSAVTHPWDLMGNHHALMGVQRYSDITLLVQVFFCCMSCTASTSWSLFYAGG